MTAVPKPTPVVKEPIISPMANLNEVVLEPTLVFDLPTVAGSAYHLVAKQ